jgi:hypothetical protein
LDSALTGVWNRIRKGYLFDVRARESDENSDDPDVRECAKIINEIGKAIERTSIDAERILELPTSDDKSAVESEDL